jgi:hypothetical protein
VIDHDGEDRERSQSVKLRLITLQRAIARQRLLRRENTSSTRSDTNPSPVRSPPHELCDNPRGDLVTNFF